MAGCRNVQRTAIPERLIEGITSSTTAHAYLGQSVIWPAFRALGEVIGKALLRAIPAHARAPVEMARA